MQLKLQQLGTDWVRIKWVKGHALNDECLASGVATYEDAFGNDQADKLAYKASRLLSIDKRLFSSYKAHLRSIAFAQAFVLRIWEARDRAGRGDNPPHNNPGAPSNGPANSGPQSPTQPPFRPASIVDLLDSGPHLFPGYPWGWPSEGTSYNVTLPEDFSLEQYTKVNAKCHWNSGCALFNAAISYFDGLPWNIQEGTGVSIPELVIDFETSQSVLLFSKGGGLPTTWEGKIKIFIAMLRKLKFMLKKTSTPR